MVLEWVPAREPVSDDTRAPSVLSSLEQAEPAAVTTALGHVQQRPLAPSLDTSIPTLEMESDQIPTLLYGLQAFSLYNYQLKSLDFVISRFFMKLFRTSYMHVVSDCQEQFNFVLPSVQLARRAKELCKQVEC